MHIFNLLYSIQAALAKAAVVKTQKKTSQNVKGK